VGWHRQFKCFPACPGFVRLVNQPPETVATRSGGRRSSVQAHALDPDQRPKFQNTRLGKQIRRNGEAWRLVQPIHPGNARHGAIRLVSDGQHGNLYTDREDTIGQALLTINPLFYEKLAGARHVFEARGPDFLTHGSASLRQLVHHILPTLTRLIPRPVEPRRKRLSSIQANKGNARYLFQIFAFVMSPDDAEARATIVVEQIFGTTNLGVHELGLGISRFNSMRLIITVEDLLEELLEIVGQYQPKTSNPGRLDA
jgi:hypothetical protein